jgi:hypothetical protein
MTQTTATRIDPLADGTVPVTVTHGGESTEVPGRIVAPGLAITRVAESKEHRPRYSLTHVPSGLTIGITRCGAHIEPVARLAAELGVDWAADKGVVIEALMAEGRIGRLRTGAQCRGHCDGDGPEPKSWGACCHTCHWEWEDEHDEGPLDAKQAKEVARDHECRPEVQICAPDSTRWVDPFFVNDDGTVRDLRGKGTND